jgi:hypothetical protein
MMNITTRRQLWLDGQRYVLDVQRAVTLPPDAPRLLIVSYLPNEQAFFILKACVDTIQRFTPEPHEIWIVDNHSPEQYANRLDELQGVNLVFSRTEPHPWVARFSLFPTQQKDWGSYANAIALEIGARMVDPDTQLLMTLHMDTMPCHSGWLTYLRSKLNERVRASGVRMDTARVKSGILHVLGYLIDFQLFRQLKLDFFPQLPSFDVGDRAIVKIRQAGYELFACPNSLWDEKLVITLPAESPFRSLAVDRSFDDSGNVIFLHLGRGVRKSSGEVVKGTTPEQWIKFANEHLLA